MGLPDSRDLTFVDGVSQIPAATMNTIQDLLAGLARSRHSAASDGSVHLDGGSPCDFASLTVNTYTMTRDCFVDVLTHDNGITLKSNGYIIHAKKYVPASGAILDCSGGNGGTPTLGAKAVAGTIGGGEVGVVGSSGTGAGGNGVSISDSLGGNGGDSGYTLSAQTGGVATQLTATQGSPYHWPFAAIGHVTGAGAITMINGGASGGSGSSSSGTGGGSGAGGGVIVLDVGILDLTNANAGFIRAKGGNGGNAASTGGGGGGGGGGVILGVYDKLVGAGVHAFSYFCNVAGGAPGTNATWTHAGTSGAAGTIIGLLTA